MSTILPIPSQEPARRVPDIPFPAYRYVPGVNPHPFRHIGGHSREGIKHYDPIEPWWKDTGWLYGMDLFDMRYYWEAHEVWEWQWKKIANPHERVLLQGLIKSAASILKVHMGQPRPAELLWTSAKQLFLSAQKHTRGLNVEASIDNIEAFHKGGDWPLLQGGYYGEDSMNCDEK